MSVLGIWIVSVRAEREVTDDFYVISILKIGLKVESFIVMKKPQLRSKYNVVSFDYIHWYTKQKWPVIKKLYISTISLALFEMYYATENVNVLSSVIFLQCWSIAYKGLKIVSELLLEDKVKYWKSQGKSWDTNKWVRQWITWKNPELWHYVTVLMAIIFMCFFVWHNSKPPMCSSGNLL